MISIGFNLEVDEGASAPSPSEFADALAEALPKEWWADRRCDSWGVTGLFPTVEMSASEALSLGQALAQKDKKIEKLEAFLAQERRLVAKIDAEAYEQRGEIAGLENTLAEREATQDDFAKRVRELIDERDRLQSKYDGSLIEWKVAHSETENLRMTIRVQDDSIESLRRLLVTADRHIARLKSKTLDASAEAQEHTIMVERIVNALEAAGYDVAGNA